MSTDISAEADGVEQQRSSSSTTGNNTNAAGREQGGQAPSSTLESYIQHSNENTPLLNHEDSDELIVYYSDNSSQVRIIHWALYLLSALLFVWVALLIADSFVSIPWIDNPGSSFLELDWAALLLFNSVLAIRFFTVPTMGDFIVSCTTVALFLINTILVLSVPILRHRHATVAGLITAWGAIVGLGLTCTSDWIVSGIYKSAFESGYRTRRPYKRLFEASVSFVLHTAIMVLMLLLTIGFCIQTVVILKGNTNPGRLTTTNTQHGVYLKCSPKLPHSNTTIIVEAGDSTYSSEDFASWIIESQSDKHQVCFWDRPGMGYSDSAPSPQSVGSVADALTEALAKHSIGSNYVLVSHGNGGIYSRVFASRHVQNLSMLILVEAVHEDLYFHKLTIWYGFKEWIKGLLAPVTHGRQSKARIQQQVTKELSKTELSSASHIVPSKTPLVVISSSETISGDRRWSEGQRKLTQLTKNNIAWKILDGPHELWHKEKTKRQLQALLNDVIDVTL